MNDSQRKRYARHLSLSELGEQGQDTLLASSVVVIGAGGLGSPCLQYLAAAGIGRIGIVDNDRVELSNLQRQILHTTDRIGMNKAESAALSLAALDPALTIEVHPLRLNVDNALSLLSAYDVVIDGTDNFGSRYLISDACEILQKPLIYGAIQRFSGQVSVFNYRGGPSYRDIFPTPPPPHLAPNCAEAGVLGVLPGVIGTIQATEAIKVLLQRDDTLSGTLMLYDALAMKFDRLNVQRDPVRPPVTSLEAVDASCSAVPYTRLSAAELRRRLGAGWAPTIIDVRTLREHQFMAFPGTSHHVAHTDIASFTQEEASGDILLLCRSGGRSARAAQALVDADFDPARIFDLEGGLLAWREEVDHAFPVAELS